MSRTIILASQSVARKALLESLGYKVIPVATFVNEDHSYKDFTVATHQLALRKLYAYLEKEGQSDSIVVAADTLVSIDSIALGKPKDRKEAFQQLSLLQGREHEVISGYALYLPLSPEKGKIYSGYDRVKVLFKSLSDEAIEDYLDTQEFMGAAGSYRIQQGGKGLISSITGDIATVVGLPIIKISAILKQPENFVYQEYPPKGEK